MDSLKLALVAGALAAAFATGWAVNGWRQGAKVAKLEASHATAVSDSLREGLREFSRMVGERDAKQAELTRVSAQGLAAVEKAKNENDRLTRCLANGTCWVRIPASCPPPPTDVPKAPGSGGVDSAGGAVLPAAVGQTVLDLRRNIEVTETTLRACQASLAVLATTPAAPSPAR